MPLTISDRADGEGRGNAHAGEPKLHGDGDVCAARLAGRLSHAHANDVHHEHDDARAAFQSGNEGVHALRVNAAIRQWP